MENYFAEFYERDLLKLRDEVKNFRDDYNLWRTKEGISNSAGTLVLHLLGNLNFGIGTQIAKNGYVRDREYEFSATDVPREELIAGINNLIEVVKSALTGITREKLDEIYPLDKFGRKSTAYYLAFFHAHLNYHLGQINYLRRILE
ncbi:DinB family protein [Mucilaginibacter sp. BJC16-A38]|uniref:DinB family protein n=1 Tax=Mucilaginibacter phenanthrenivorans TaxID=1234842 RepID=UPI00215876B0|nr:DinB family protein [Mucilaginibacter phenanthrenivorans]MCR8561095.1 DinB family protein [Mucilaginibacter phenanthrenivorans]